MIVTTIREFRDNATKIFRGEEPILVTRRGKVAGIFFPYTEQSIPVEFKQDLFKSITDSIGKKLKQAGMKEGEILEDFERHREARRRR